MSTNGNPALVLNADFHPLNYYPLSLCSWQDAIKAVFLQRVSVIENYDAEVHSPSRTLKMPSVIALKNYVSSMKKQSTKMGMFKNIVVATLGLSWCSLAMRPPIRRRLVGLTVKLFI